MASGSVRVLVRSDSIFPGFDWPREVYVCLSMSSGVFKNGNYTPVPLRQEMMSNGICSSLCGENYGKLNFVKVSDVKLHFAHVFKGLKREEEEN